ncbi:hypothetical protein TNCV_4496091 [Trichonephila clavipes]|nr:hypothetical protein TNCV_4496091 [Trichonephila clavipes]
MQTKQTAASSLPIDETEAVLMLISKYRTLKSKKSTYPPIFDPELRFSKHIEQTANKALGKLNILRKLKKLIGAQDLKP